MLEESSARSVGMPGILPLVRLAPAVVSRRQNAPHVLLQSMLTLLDQQRIAYRRLQKVLARQVDSR